MRTLPVIAAGLAFTLAGCTAPASAAHHPARLTVLGDCRTLRADVLANGGTPDAREVLYLLRQDPGKAGAIHGSHGLTMDLDWMYSALTARNRGAVAGRRFTGRWEAELAGDCQRAAGVTITGTQPRPAPVTLGPAAGVRLVRR